MDGVYMYFLLFWGFEENVVVMYQCFVDYKNCSWIMEYHNHINQTQLNSTQN